MTVRLSQLIGLDVYSDNAQYIGKVHDIILDLEKGDVVRLTLEPIRASSREDAKRIFKEKTVLYKSVKAVEKIIIVSPNSNVEPEPEVEKPAFESKHMPYAYRYRRPA